MDILLGNQLIQTIFPFVNNTIASTIHIRHAGWLNTRILAMYMLSIASERGLAQFTGEITGIDTTGQVKQITLTTTEGHKSILTHNVVLAPGPFLPSMTKMLDISLPIDNILQQKILIQDTKINIRTDNPFMIFSGCPTD